MTLSPLLGPAAALILWSLIVLLWVVMTRFPAFARVGIDIRTAPRGARYCDVEENMPAEANWVSHNYTHLMEQPTLFYAVIAVLAIAGDAAPVNLAAAWGYTVIRVIHSLWQGLGGAVVVRAGLFTLSTLCLIVLAVNAVRVTSF